MGATASSASGAAASTSTSQRAIASDVPTTPLSPVRDFAAVAPASASHRCAPTTSGTSIAAGSAARVNHDRSTSSSPPPCPGPSSTTAAQPPIPRPSVHVTEHAVRSARVNHGSTRRDQSLGFSSRFMYASDVRVASPSTSYSVKYVRLLPPAPSVQT
jgi:hypothetical protein